MSHLERAIAIAVEAHRGQKDKNGAAYILHPLRVVARVNSEVEKIAAILHDVVEDTDWTLDRLRNEGFSAEVIQAIDCVTKREAAGLTPTKDRIDWRFKAGEIRGRKLTRRLTKEQVVQAIKASPLKFSRSWEQMRKV